MLGIVLGVKRDAEFKNDIVRRVSQRLGAVSMHFNVNGVAFSKDFRSSCLSHVGYHSRG